MMINQIVLGIPVTINNVKPCCVQTAIIIILVIPICVINVPYVNMQESLHTMRDLSTGLDTVVVTNC